MKIIPILLIAFCQLCYGLDIIPSSLDLDKENKRERVFEKWIPASEGQKEFDEMVREKAKFPIYHERQEGKQRDIYINMFDDMSFYTFGSMTEQDLLEKHEDFTRDGFILLSLVITSHNEQEIKYWATWINKYSEKKALRKLEYLGISQAVIKK